MTKMHGLNPDDAELVWAKAGEHRRLINRLYNDVSIPTRTERDAAISRAMATRDLTVTKAHRLLAQQLETVVASLRKDLRRTRHAHVEQIALLGEHVWERLVLRALQVVAAPCELKPWQGFELTVPICQMVLWIEPARERASSIAACHRRAHATTINAANQTFHEGLNSAYERWHWARVEARAIHKWGRDRRQRICKEFLETGDGVAAIAKLSEMISYDEWLPSPGLSAQEYLRQQEGIDAWPSIRFTVRKRAA